ncbi:MAG: hypothetical protein QF645_11795 [Planctomycetota bacterium]|nr:hypothetical protein [Planctomycetota bacterium]
MLQITCTCGRQMQLVHAPDSGVVLCSGCLSEVSVPRKKGRVRPRMETKSIPREVWVTCPRCRNSYSRSGQYAGRKTRCPVCAKKRRIPKRAVERSRVGRPRVEEKSAIKPLLFGVGFVVLMIFCIILFTGSASPSPSSSPLVKRKRVRIPEPAGYLSKEVPPSDTIPQYDPVRMRFDASPLIRKIKLGVMTSNDWERWSAPTHSVWSRGKLVLDFPRNKKTYILLLPCPDDVWHGNSGKSMESPWVGYQGQKFRTLRGLPLMSLCWSREYAPERLQAVYRVPLIEVSGPLTLFPNDRSWGDNRKSIRVKVVRVERDR